MMSINIYLDESIRNYYLLCFVYLNDGNTSDTRKKLIKFRSELGSSLHMNHANSRKRAKIIKKVMSFDIEVVIAEDLSFKTRKTQSRQICLRAGFEYAAKNQISRIMLDRSNTTALDLKTYKKVKHKFPHLPKTIYHLPSKQEPLLWLADIFAWSYGAGGYWRKSIEQKVIHKITLI